MVHGVRQPVKSAVCVCVIKARFPLLELTARVDGWPVSITRQHGPCWRAPGFHTSRVDGPSWRVMETGHPSTRAVNSASGNRAFCGVRVIKSDYKVTQ